MKRFLINSIFACLIFACSLIGIYTVLDPFKVVYNYDNYSDSIFIINRDFVSTQTFLNNYEELGYNSFIFGSSRVMGFNPTEWGEILKKNGQENIIPYTFDAFEETIEGIYQKILFLNKKKIEVKNVLIVLCRDVTFSELDQKKSPVLMKHPATSDNSYFGFHKFYFSSFSNPEFLKRYLDFKISGKYKPYMRGYFESKKLTIDPINNFLQFESDEREFSKDSIKFLNARKEEYKKRSNIITDTIPRINEEHKKYLAEITKILKSNNINYKVVLSPLFEQVRWHNNDVDILKKTFSDNFYDFSGINNFTNNNYNYYESSHFRPNVGFQIMNIIYE